MLLLLSLLGINKKCYYILAHYTIKSKGTTKGKHKGKEGENKKRRKRTTDKMGRQREKETGPGQRLIKAVKNCEKLLKRFSQGREKKTEKEQEKERRVERRVKRWGTHEKCHTKREL